MARALAAVVFDLDGVLIDSEQVWDEARRELVEEAGGRWTESAQRDMMGMSSVEWSRYMHGRLGVSLTPEQISRAVVAKLEQRYREHVPLIAGAREAVERLARRWPLALASSANRPVIDLVLELTGLDRCFAATVSSEEVARGKPAPDVYLAAAAGLAVDPARAAAVEDSSNGLLAAHAAGMRVIAIPNRAFPPSAEALAVADAVLERLEELTPELIEALA